MSASVLHSHWNKDSERKSSCFHMLCRYQEQCPPPAPLPSSESFQAGLSFEAILKKSLGQL